MPLKNTTNADNGHSFKSKLKYIAHTMRHLYMYVGNVATTERHERLQGIPYDTETNMEINSTFLKPFYRHLVKGRDRIINQI